MNDQDELSEQFPDVDELLEDPAERAPSDAPTIDVVAVSMLSYALAHNRVPVVSRVAISGVTSLSGQRT